MILDGIKWNSMELDDIGSYWMVLDWMVCNGITNMNYIINSQKCKHGEMQSNAKNKAKQTVTRDTCATSTSEAKQSNAYQSNTQQSKAKQHKAQQSTAKQSNAKHNEGQQDKAKHRKQSITIVSTFVYSKPEKTQEHRLGT